MPFLVTFVLSWICFYVLADRSIWRLYLPACFLSTIMSLTTDVLMTRYDLWVYEDPTGLVGPKSQNFFDDFGIYPVVTYLFLQKFPAKQALSKQFRYLLFWTTLAICIEFVYFIFGWMKHNHWWNHGWSYVADWLIFLVLLGFQRLMQQGWLAAGFSKELQFPAPVTAEGTPPGLDIQFGMAGQTDVVSYELQPGNSIPLHTHSLPERLVLVRGQVELTIGQETRTLSAGAELVLPANVPHSFLNSFTEPAAMISLFEPQTHTGT